MAQGDLHILVLVTNKAHSTSDVTVEVSSVTALRTIFEIDVTMLQLVLHSSVFGTLIPVANLSSSLSLWPRSSLPPSSSAAPISSWVQV